MQIVQVDDLGIEAPQAVLAGRLERRGPAVDDAAHAGLGFHALNAALARPSESGAKRRRHARYELFVLTEAVECRRVEVRDAEIQGAQQNLRPDVGRRRDSVGVAQVHAPETDGRYGTGAELALVRGRLHCWDLTQLRRLEPPASNGRRSLLLRRGHAAELAALEILDGRFDLLPRVHHEGTVAHNGFRNGRAAQQQQRAVGGGLDVHQDALAIQNQQFGIARVPRSVDRDAAPQHGDVGGVALGQGYGGMAAALHADVPDIERAEGVRRTLGSGEAAGDDAYATRTIGEIDLRNVRLEECLIARRRHLVNGR